VVRVRGRRDQYEMVDELLGSVRAGWNRVLMVRDA
jgi:hypothetical protein